MGQLAELLPAVAFSEDVELDELLDEESLVVEEPDEESEEEPEASELDEEDEPDSACFRLSVR